MPNPTIPTSNSAKAGKSVVGVNASSLHSVLVQSGIQKSDPPTYQTIGNLIDGVFSFQKFAQSALSGLQTAGAALAVIVQALVDQVIADEELLVFIYEFDSTTGPHSFDLSTDYVKGRVVIKDIGGNAFMNNITIIGTVDDILNPVLDSNFGVYHLYKSLNGNFYTW